MRSEVGGVVFDGITTSEAVSLVFEAIERGRGGRVVTPNVDFLRVASTDLQAAQLIAEADLVLADGMPVVWASRLAGCPLPERVAGSALAPRLAAGAAERGVGLFLLGGEAGAAERAAAVLKARHPNLRVGWHFPPFGFERDLAASEETDAAVEHFGPCVCLVGLGFPKQDRLGARLLERNSSSWFVGSGASIAFLAGDRSRAPAALQRTGLEWLYRLLQEPKRLGQRYAFDIPFAIRLLARAIVRRALGPAGFS